MPVFLNMVVVQQIAAAKDDGCAIVAPDFVFHISPILQWATGAAELAMEEGDGAGFDVASFDSDGRERLIEVKTTNGAATTPFFLTSNEMAVAGERSEHWHLYRVHLFAQRPQVFTGRPPLENVLRLDPETCRASPRGEGIEEA